MGDKAGHGVGAELGKPCVKEHGLHPVNNGKVSIQPLGRQGRSWK